jgi:predicted nucleic acid-binding protein
MDTNVLLSGLVSRNGKSFQILQLLAEERFHISISVPVVLEYEAILRKKLNREIYSDQDIVPIRWEASCAPIIHEVGRLKPVNFFSKEQTST